MVHALVSALSPAWAVLIFALTLAATASGPASGSSAAEQAAALLRHLESSAVSVSRALAEVGSVRFASSHDGWRSSGVEITAGESLTLFAFATSEPGSGAATPPGDLLWIRIGDGPVEPMGSDTESLVAAESGAIQLGVRPDGVRWTDCTGALPPSAAEAPKERLDLVVVAVRWSGDIEEGLEGLDQHAAGRAALADFREKPSLPDGFRYLCHLPRRRVFHAWEDGERRGVHALAPGDVGIIKKELDLPLTEASEITFEWRYDGLPALGPETDARTHDYSSIAIEFDNGQDITWMWSSHLDAGTDFRCPLPWWDQRETHIVLQSGVPDLGTWFTHTRNISVDYDRAVGGQRPRRIVGVWFITNGTFGGGTADATFANVAVRSGKETVQVFEPATSR